MIHLEKILVKALSFVFPYLKFRGNYRLANFIYPYRKNKFQKGIWINKRYLDHKYNLSINLFSKDLIDHKILFTGEYEAETNWILKNQIAEGQVVLEAGANSGTETLLMSRLVGETGRVHAFEPFERVASKLRDNILINAIKNTEVNLLALGAKKETISFFVHPEDHPNQGMSSSNPGKQGLTEIKVQQTTIDSLYSEGRFTELNFIKMDVQGSELSILNGGENCITKCKPKIFLEAADGWSNVTAIYDQLVSLDYTVFYITGNLSLKEMNSTSLISGNWLALPSVTK